MKVYPPRDILPFVMYCVNGKLRSFLLIESTDSMIILMSFSASNNFIIVVTVVDPRVCVYLAVRSSLSHVHLHPDVRVHRGIENSFI